MIEVRLSNNSPEEHGRLIGWMDVEIEDKQPYYKFYALKQIDHRITDDIPVVAVEREGVDYLTLYLGEMRMVNRPSWLAFMFDNTRANRDAILKVREFRPDVEWFRMWEARDRGAWSSRSRSSRLGWKRRDEGV